MKKNHLIRNILIVFLMILFTIMPVIGLADAGYFSGDDDYGWSDEGFDDWNDDWDSDYDNSWDSGLDDDWGPSGAFIPAGMFFDRSPLGSGFLIFIVIVIIIFLIARKFKNGAANAASPASLQPMPKSIDLSEYLKIDPEFSKDAFLEKVSNLYVQLQQNWQDKDLAPMRPHMTDALYNQFDRQLQELVEAKQTNRIERIAVLGTAITNFTQDDVNNIFNVRIRSRVVDYVVDDVTGDIVRGSNQLERFMDYDWTFIRSKDAATETKDGVEATTCPNCGAPLDINHSARCPYCDSVITSNDYDWVVSSIKGISQRTL